MPTITGRVTGWTTSPQNGFTVSDDRTNPPTTVTVTESVSDTELLAAIAAKGAKDTVTLTYSGSPPTVSCDGLKSP